MSEAASKFVETNGFRTHYIEAGLGPPLILIHGGGAGADSAGNWRATLPMFAKERRVLAIDMVGFGQGEAPDPSGFVYSQDARNEQLVDFIEALELNEVSIVGNSMGGSTALGAAIRRPDLVANLVLMGSSGLNHAITDALKPMMNYDFTRAGMERIVAVLTHDGFAAPADLIDHRYENSLRPETRRAYGATMAWVRAQGGVHYDEAAIRTVKARTLVFNGKQDRVVPMREAFRFLELIDDSTGFFLPECGHWAMIERPGIFANTVLGFLDGFTR